MVTATVVASSLLAASPHYGVMWDLTSTEADCRLVEDVEPGGAMADAGVRAGDCLRPADGSRDICASMMRASAGDSLKLQRGDGGVFVVVPTDCAEASFSFGVSLEVNDDLFDNQEVTRDADLFALLKRSGVADPSSCTARFGGHCSATQVIPITPGLSGRKAGCFTGVNIECGVSHRRTAWLQFPNGHVIAMGLKTGELPSPELRCVKRGGEPAWFDCKGSRANSAHPDAGELHVSPDGKRSDEVDD